MMKLRYLFDNRDLAEIILKNWQYDPEKLSLLDGFRISSNAVYPFEFAGKRFFLRFSPVEEHTEQAVLAEIEYIRYLCTENYPAARTIPSKAGRELECISTPWGDYLAVVFQGVPGTRLDKITLSDELITGYGQALGRLHELSRRYVNVRNKRDSWREQLNLVRYVLAGFPDESLARSEEEILRSCLEGIPATDGNFGLVHYDFELDNVFYDEVTDCFHVIDFDDAVYHWYALEIDQSIDNLTEGMMPDRASEAKELFIEGYKSISPVDNQALSAVPVFRRYVNLHGYTRFLRATAEKWDNEPEWMTNLRNILESAKQDRREFFGMTIESCGLPND